MALKALRLANRGEGQGWPAKPAENATSSAMEAKVERRRVYPATPTKEKAAATCGRDREKWRRSLGRTMYFNRSAEWNTYDTYITDEEQWDGAEGDRTEYQTIVRLLRFLLYSSTDLRISLVKEARPTRPTNSPGGRHREHNRSSTASYRSIHPPVQAHSFPPKTRAPKTNTCHL